MELEKVIEKRRSVRDFAHDKKISDSDIEKILKAGEQAPVGKGQYQDVHLTVVENDDVLNEIIESSKSQGKAHTNNVFYNAPAIIIVSQRKLETFPEIGYSNAGAILQNMLLRATDLGIDSVYVLSAISSIVGNEKVLKLLDLPADFTPTGIAVLGYNNNDSHKKFPRNIEVNWV
jgi:nitroreductase